MTFLTLKSVCESSQIKTNLNLYKNQYISMQSNNCLSQVTIFIFKDSFIRKSIEVAYLKEYVNFIFKHLPLLNIFPILDQ